MEKLKELTQEKTRIEEALKLQRIIEVQSQN